MKKLLVVMLVLAMASMASATMQLNLSSSTVNVGSDVTIVINAPTEMAQTAYFVGIALDGTTGAGSFDLTNAVVNYPGIPSSVDFQDDADLAANTFFIQNPFIIANLTDTVTPIDAVLGNLVSGIKLNTSAVGDIVLNLFDGDANLLYTTTVTVNSIVPEPITIGLLGLGGLFLRRRSK
jgi:hypothetical protein